MTYDQILERIIFDGIAEVRAAYDNPEDHHKRDGAIEGFEACRGKTPTEIVELWRAAEKHAHQLMRASQSDINDFWRQRYKTIQVEFVLNVLSAALQRSLLGNLPTARGMMKYAEIVGVNGGNEVLS